MSGFRVLRGLFGLFLVSALAMVLLFACWEVILAGHLITQLPFRPWQEQAIDWTFGRLQVTSRADIGFPLQGYVGPAGAVEGLPVPYPVTSHFGFAPDYFGGTRFHTGVDVACPEGTPVTNVMAGQVTFAGYDPGGYGNLVVVENDGVQVFYGHLSRVDVTVGQVVDAGAIVGATGNTGWSTGPHLHWEVRVNGTPVDPLQATLPGEGGDR